MSEKNPYSSDTPEWQLWENKASNESLFHSYSQDAEASLRKAHAAREKAGKYSVALDVLDRTKENNRDAG